MKQYTLKYPGGDTSDYQEFPSLDALLAVMEKEGASRILVKRLSPNDNSKNQVYLGGDFSSLQGIPFGEVSADKSRKDSKRDRFKASIGFEWMNGNGDAHIAPNAQLILYPKYPEVRLSGFLAGVSAGPNKLMTTRDAGRVMLLAVTGSGRLLAHVVSHDSAVRRELDERFPDDGVKGFKHWPQAFEADSRSTLLRSLKEVHEAGWVPGFRLRGDGTREDYNAPSAGGYTLEGLLGIQPNSDNLPDFLGWELKQHKAPLDRPLSGGAITLIDTTPDFGDYAALKNAGFIRAYGYPDKSGIPDRINFGGVHRFGIKQQLTGLTLLVEGFDIENAKITDIDGAIRLVGKDGSVAGGWSFAELVSKWNRKHTKAAYVPAQMKKVGARRHYRFGNVVGLGDGTSFDHFLSATVLQSVYYDPAMKLENASTSYAKSKVRSLFRIKPVHLPTLYRSFETVSVCD